MTGTKTNAPVIAMKQTREGSGMTLNYRITDPNTADVLAQKLMQIFTQAALEKLSVQDGEAV